MTTNVALSPTEPAPPPLATLRGDVTIERLDSVRPNTWNPNHFDSALYESFKQGLVEDGWLANQSLLVWGSDEDGVIQLVIIDGEHRWKAAQELGLVEGPMVILHGLREAEAKALTIKLDQKRGKWNPALLSKLVSEIQADDPEQLSRLGFSDQELAKMTAAASEVTATQPIPQNVQNVKMVQLYLNEQNQPLFLQHCQELAGVWGLKNITDTVVRALEVMHAEECLAAAATVEVTK